MRLAGCCKASSKEHRDALHDRSPVQSPATANAIKGKDADESRELDDALVQVALKNGSTLHTM